MIDYLFLAQQLLQLGNPPLRVVVLAAGSEELGAALEDLSLPQTHRHRVHVIGLSDLADALLPLEGFQHHLELQLGEICRLVLPMAVASHVFGLNHDRIMFQAEEVAPQFVSRFWGALPRLPQRA